MIGKKINQLATELAPASTDLTIIGDPTTGVSKKITLAQLGAIFSGAVSFYTDLASFPVTGDINVIYCAKDTQKLYLWSGSAYVEVFPSQALLNTYQLRSEKGNANGYASLDSGGKVPISQLPSSIMEYKGTWNASTNTPTLANGTGDTGDVYICNVAGTVDFGAGGITFAVGDYVIYSGTIWQRSSGAVGTVTSVALTVGGDAISVSGSPLTTSGTLGLTFNGTTAQYIRGNGTLETFPSLTGFVPYTGATANVNLGTNNITAQNNILNGNGTDTGSYLAFKQYSGSNSGADGYTSLYALAQNSLYIRYSQTDLSQKNVDLSAALLGTTTRQYLFPDKNGTFAMTSDLTGGTVTSVAALTIGTTGTDLSSTVANGTTTPVITLNVPTASATNRGALSSEDWASFNSKQNAITLTTTGTSGAATLVGATLNIPNYTSGLTGYVPYTGATANLDLGTHTLIAAKGTFSSSGSGDTVGITHSSGSGIALNITKGGNGEGLYINKTSGSGNAATIIGTLNATTLVKSGGTSSQFLKADGSVDSTSYGTGSVTSVGLSSATSGVTIGSTPITTSGTITLAIATASGSAQGLLSSTDWTTFNNKQNALTNPVTGTGTINYIPKFTTTGSTIGNSNLINDTSGNLGLGVTPSAWGVVTALQIKNAFFYGFDTEAGYGANSYFNGSSWTYTTSAPASRYKQNASEHSWFIAPSGTAGNAISFTQAMTLNASGNLSLGNTNDTHKLDVTGSSRFNGTVNIGLSNNPSQALIFQNTSNAASRSQRFINDQTAFGDFQIQQSTTQTGSTYSNLLYFSPTGAATFSSSVTAAELYLSTSNGLVGNINSSNANGGYLTWQTSGAVIADIGTTQQIFGSGGNDTFGINGRGARAIAFGTNNTERMRITSGGDLLVGSTANQHSAKLNVAGKLFLPYASNSDIGGAMYSYNDTGYQLYAGGLRFQIFNNNGTSYGLRDALTISGGGNVGIGTTSPSALLSLAVASASVDGTKGVRIANPAGTVVMLECGVSSDSFVGTTSVSDFQIRTGNTERMRITSVGNVEINTGSIKTGEPDTGYGRAAIKIGARNTGQAFNSGGHLPVNIDGTIYFINVYSSLP